MAVTPGGSQRLTFSQTVSKPRQSALSPTSPMSGTDSAVASFAKGVRLTDTAPSDSQRVDVVIR
jgi:hypothetical protein